MANKIQIKRGAKANLPVLSVGEPAFTTDTKEFFIGDGSSNIEFAKQSDLDMANTKLSDLTYQTAGGTATAITLTMQALVNGYAKAFIASTNNNAAATTINGKPLYKPGTTVAPNLIAGKAYTVWYSSTGGCFFIKASAEGTAGVGQVLAGYTFSNDSDTGLSGTISSKSAATYTPTTTDQTIAANQYLSGAQTVKGDANLVTGNIKSGASIFGVAGKSSVVDTSDANATSGQILLSQTAYVNGSKIIGTMPNRANTKFQICGYEGITECIPHPSDPGNQGLVTGQNVYGANGYIDGNSQIQMSVAGLVPGNIKAGVKVGKLSGSGSSVMTGTFTSDATANAGQILNGQTAYVNGNKITGTMPNRGTYQYTGNIGSGYDGNSYLAFNNIPWGYYQSNNDGWSPEIRAKFSDVANYIGLTADKLVSGNNILGINGTATIQNLGGKNVAAGSFVGTGSSPTVTLGFNIGWAIFFVGKCVYVSNIGYSGVPSFATLTSAYNGRETNYLYVSGSTLTWGTALNNGQTAYYIAIGS